jgi:hypothetical protein
MSRPPTVCHRSNWLKLLSVVRKKFSELSSVVKREADLKKGDDVRSYTFIRRTIDIHTVGMRFAVKLSFSSSQLRRLSV